MFHVNHNLNEDHDEKVLIIAETKEDLIYIRLAIILKQLPEILTYESRFKNQQFLWGDSEAPFYVNITINKKAVYITFHDHLTGQQVFYKNDFKFIHQTLKKLGII